MSARPRPGARAVATPVAASAAAAVAVPRRVEPVHDPARPASRHLRVVPAVRPRRGHLAARGFAVLTVLSLLAVASFHAVIAQRQQELDAVRERTAQEQRRYELSRAAYAAAAAPERIVQAALASGMVEPDRLTTVPVDLGAGEVGDAGGAPAVADRWADLKPLLAGGR